MGSILDRSRADWQRFSSKGGFEVPVTFTPPSGSPVTVSILAMKHHLSYSVEGGMVNSKNAHLTVPEGLLTVQGYITRNGNGEAALVGHTVEYVDSTGVGKKYIINENYADETVGIITCILSDYE